MQLTLELPIPALPKPIIYSDKILLIGSCFTEHISKRLSQHKFKILSNPNGNIFNPLSVAASLNNYVSGKIYQENDLFLFNELWSSWEHHSDFSDIDKEIALQKINQSQQESAHFIKDVDWIIITLGSAFCYNLKENGNTVANNHRAPAQWFEKKLIATDSIVKNLSHAMQQILSVNSKAKFLFTISPVRHIKDGVIENNRSKARLIEAVHTICESTQQCFYFPAYEIVIDILRDYRFYDIDFVHPNYLATQYVWERFMTACIDKETRKIMEAVKEIIIARNHRSRFPKTEAHKKFRADHRKKIEALIKQFPFLNLEEEKEFFSA